MKKTIKKVNLLFWVLIMCMFIFLSACSGKERGTDKAVNESASEKEESTVDNKSTQNSSDSTTKTTGVVENVTKPSSGEGIGQDNNSTDKNSEEKTSTENVTTSGTKPTESVTTSSSKPTENVTTSSSKPIENVTTSGTKPTENITTSGSKPTTETTQVSCNHIEVTDVAVAATCLQSGKTEGKYCSKCNKVIVPQGTIPALGHDEVTVAGKNPTGTEAGLTSGKKCNRCGEITVTQKVIPAYVESANDDYAYNDLGKQKKGSEKQTLYNRIDEKAKIFHTTDMAAQGNVAIRAQYSDLGLNESDVITVWQNYKNDHPLYYWISDSVNLDAGSVCILTDAEYATGTSRKKYNEKIYNEIAKCMNLVGGETSTYQIALAFHDEIIERIDYAYELDGITAEDAAWAHNILGVFDKGSGVCESYARTYQLLLNVCGIENVIVTGTAGTQETGFENHAWNLVKFDDNKWYWCDLTWDDEPAWEWGIKYNYFCVNDTQNVNWVDSIDQYQSKSFMDTHNPGITVNDQISYEVTLPSRSTSKFTSKTEKLVRDKFTVSGMTYSIAGYKKLQLINVSKSGVVTVPETVKYSNRSYTVISIGAAFENGYYGDMMTVFPESTKITIPKSIRFIWDYAFGGNEITEITVNSANPYFKSVDGVLYTKSLYTLIQYPCNKAKNTKFVIPDQTVRVENSAFDGIRNPFEQLVIGKNVEIIGIKNWGEGYWDEEPKGFGGNFVIGSLGTLTTHCASTGHKLEISVASGNKYYEVVDGVVYIIYTDIETNEKYHEALCPASTEVTAISLTNKTRAVQPQAFSGCTKLTSVSFGNGVVQFYGGAFGCISLNQINYNGTMSQWNAITKDSYWNVNSNSETPKVKIICTDGVIQM